MVVCNISYAIANVCSYARLWENGRAVQSSEVCWRNCFLISLKVLREKTPPLLTHPLLYLVSHPFIIHEEHHLNYCKPRCRVLFSPSNLMSNLISASSRYHHIWPAGWLWEIQLAGKLLHRPFLQLAVRRGDDPVSRTKIHLSGAGGASEGLRYDNLVTFTLS